MTGGMQYDATVNHLKAQSNQGSYVATWGSYATLWAWGPMRPLNLSWFTASGMTARGSPELNFRDTAG